MDFAVLYSMLAYSRRLFVLAILLSASIGCGGDDQGPCPDGLALCEQVCVDLSSDRTNCGGCRVTCLYGQDCQDGECQEGCMGQCHASGDTRCLGDGYQTCDDHDQDGCLEWNNWIECGRCSECSEGQCVATCTDECDLGQRRCTGNSWQECGDYDADEGYEWSQPSDCPEGETCEAGYCVDLSCRDACPLAGDTRCLDDGYQTCDDYDSDGCLEWGDWVECGRCSICDAGGCLATCTDECLQGERRCSGNAWQECGNYDADEAWEWGGFNDCPEGEICQAGYCVEEPCQDQCPQTGATRCQGDGFQTCDDYDSDGCLEWDALVECGRCSECENGECLQTCTDECALGDVECVGNAWRECGEYDFDEGYEWSGLTECGNDEVCENGQCLSTQQQLGIDIYVDNYCNMEVIPAEVTIPAGQTARLTYYNRSVDYPVDVWLSYIGGFLDLPCGQSWADQFEWCTGPNPYTGYADITTACSEHRLYIHCQ